MILVIRFRFWNLFLMMYLCKELDFVRVERIGCIIVEEYIEVRYRVFVFFFEFESICYRVCDYNRVSIYVFGLRKNIYCFWMIIWCI